MTRITLDVLGTRQVDRTLTRWADALKDARPLWEELAAEFGRANAQQFGSQGAASGGWAALSPGYAEWKARHYPGAPILVRTGALMRSLTARPYGVERITRDSLTVGTNIDYAWYHQHGTSRMPARPPVEFTDARRREWVRIIQRHVVQAGR